MDIHGQFVTSGKPEVQAKYRTTIDAIDELYLLLLGNKGDPKKDDLIPVDSEQPGRGSVRLPAAESTLGGGGEEKKRRRTRRRKRRKRKKMMMMMSGLFMMKKENMEKKQMMMMTMTKTKTKSKGEKEEDEKEGTRVEEKVVVYWQRNISREPQSTPRRT